MTSQDETNPPESFNDLIQGHSRPWPVRTPQQVAADAIESAQQTPTFNDLIRGRQPGTEDES